MHFAKSNFMATALAIYGIAPSVQHMMLSAPVPYGKSSLDNSPLVATGTDFPCKQRAGVYDDQGARAKNQMPIGKPQTMSFLGSATHGGGSCQISLTGDKEPTKDSKWIVIKSIEGGCPGGANGGTSATFQYSIPSAVAPGDYTLAWTWFNKIGNREMYMNCAPITVTGGSKKRNVGNATMSYDSAFNKRGATMFPQMFVANAGQANCHTADSTVLAFQDPGTEVQKDSEPLTPPTGQCPKLPQIPAPGASGSSSAGSSSNSSSAATPASGNSTASAAPGTQTILASGAPSPSDGSPASAPPASASPSAAAAAPSGSAAAAPSASPSAAATPVPSGSTSSSTCASASQIVCSSDGKQFGICESGGHAQMQPVADGTVCKNGAIGFAKKKRSAKFRHAAAANVGGWY